MAVKYSPFYRFSGFDTSTDGNWHDCTIKIIINDNCNTITIHTILAFLVLVKSL